MNLPLISIVVPTKNEEKNIERCLHSIFNQDYPHNKMEVILVDDSSIDRTLEIAKNFPVKILKHNSNHAEIGKKIGFDKSSGLLFMYFDADCQFGDHKSLSKLIDVLIKEDCLSAVFTAESTDDKSSNIERYLSLDSLQRDPVFQYLSPSVESTIVFKKRNYFLCEYKAWKIPPSGRCLYRKKIIENILKNEKEFRELDILVEMVENNFNKFGYVPGAKIYHHHVNSIRQLIKKRKYNIQKVYFKFYDKKKYLWINWKNPISYLKLLFWVLYANSIIGPTISSFYKILKFRTWLGIYDFVIIPLLTNLYIYWFFKMFLKRNIFRN